MFRLEAIGRFGAQSLDVTGRHQAGSQDPTAFVTLILAGLRGRLDAGEAYGRRLWDAGVEASILRCVGHPYGVGEFSTLTSAAYRRTLKIAALLQAYGVAAFAQVE